MLGRHPASVSSAAVSLAAELLPGGFARRLAVVLGAGEAAEGVLRSLHLSGAANVALVNRSPQRATTLAAAWGAVPHGWDRLPELAAAADFLFVATAAARPVVSAVELASAMAARGGRPLTAIDLSVPRNVEPEARVVPGLTLLDLDDLQRLCCPAAGTASAALREAETRVSEEIARLELALRGRAAAPRLAELHRHGAQVAEQEAAWALAQLGELSEEEQRVVREMAERLVRRVLYPVSRSLREEPANSEPEPLTEPT
jgi:glutamyl-tRNA reductase